MGFYDLIALITADVLQKVLDNWYGYDETDVLCTLQALKRYANNLRLGFGVWGLGVPFQSMGALKR